MKITSGTKSKDEVVIVSQKQIEKKTVQLGSSVLRPGHTCFELNTKTLDCIHATYQREANFIGGFNGKIITKENCVYINALNKKNALKIYKRDFVGMDRVFNHQSSFSRIDFFNRP